MNLKSSAGLMDSNEIAFKSHQSLSIEKRQPQNDLLEMLCRELVQREMTDSKFVRPIKFGRYKVAIKTIFFSQKI